MTLQQKLASYRTWLKVTLCIVCAFFLAQFLMSFIAKHYANAAINSYPGLSGEIGSVKLSFHSWQISRAKCAIALRQRGKP